MILALVLGVLLAVMRLSPNPVLKAVAWTYLWIFRGTPIYVQLVLWGLVPVIYKNIQIGVPFGPRLFEFSLSDPNVFWLAVLGLGLNEAAYMAEIIRGGLISVPEGQTEASVALGMSWGMTMRRTVSSPGDARHHPADRQRVHQHAEDHVTGHRRSLQLRVVTVAQKISGSRCSNRFRCCWWPPPGTWRSPAS